MEQWLIPSRAASGAVYSCVECHQEIAMDDGPDLTTRLAAALVRDHRGCLLRRDRRLHGDS